MCAGSETIPLKNCFTDSCARVASIERLGAHLSQWMKNRSSLKHSKEINKKSVECERPKCDGEGSSKGVREKDKQDGVET